MPQEVNYREKDKNFELTSFGKFCRRCKKELTPKDVKNKQTLCKKCTIGE